MDPSRQAIVALAKRIISGELDPVSGCRAIVQRQWDLSEVDRKNDDFAILAAIESETDHFPLGAARARWSQAALEEQDRTRVAYSERNAKYAVSACSRLVEAWDGHRED